MGMVGEGGTGLQSHREKRFLWPVPCPMLCAVLTSDRVMRRAAGVAYSIVALHWLALLRLILSPVSPTIFIRGYQSH